MYRRVRSSLTDAGRVDVRVTKTHHWMHHVELRDPAEVDAEIVAWLVEAADRAG